MKPQIRTVQTVYKYTLPIEDHVTVRMPVGAEILHVDAQHEQICVWARVDMQQQVDQERHFRIAGTGHPYAEGSYLGSAMLHDGPLAFHVFEVVE